MPEHPTPPNRPTEPLPEDPYARGPEHLWAGDWEAWSEDAHFLRRTRPPAAPEATRAEEQPAAAPPAPGRRSLRNVALGTAAGLLAGGVFLAGALTLGHKDEQKPASALPAAITGKVKPKQGQTRAGAVYAAASPAVASVRAGNASGTAFLIDSDGTLVTNSHVVEGQQHVTVRFGEHASLIDADVLGSDVSSDLAVLSIEPGSIPKGVKPLELADSRRVQVGDTAIAIGNPFGLERTATEGIVSAVGRSITAPNNFSIDEVIQTDAPINPGNSGGPLLDDSGLVIGVNSQIATSGAGSQGNVGIGFAVPSNTVRSVVPVLKKGLTVQRAYLGVKSGETQRGVQLASVEPGGPAEEAGLEVGDIVKTFDGKGLGDPSQLSAAVNAKKPGDKVEIEIERDGASKKVTVTLAERPDQVP